MYKCAWIRHTLQPRRTSQQSLFTNPQLSTHQKTQTNSTHIVQRHYKQQNLTNMIINNVKNIDNRTKTLLHILHVINFECMNVYMYVCMFVCLFNDTMVSITDIRCHEDRHCRMRSLPKVPTHDQCRESYVYIGTHVWMNVRNEWDEWNGMHEGLKKNKYIKKNIRTVATTLANLELRTTFCYSFLVSWILSQWGKQYCLFG